MRFPTHDWQFWAATALVLLVALWALRAVLPIPFLGNRAKRKKQERRATLTVGGRAVTKGRGPECH